MIIFENTKNVLDLVHQAGEEYGNKTFLRYERNEQIQEKSYADLSRDCDAISHWTEEMSRKSGRKVHSALLGRCSYEYIAAMLGTMNTGAVAVPLDVQLSKEGFADNLNRAEVEVLFYDWEFHSQVEVIKGTCPNIKYYICMQNRKQLQCIEEIFKKYGDKKYENEIDADDCALIIFTSGTTGRGKGVMLSHTNLIDNTFCTTETEDQSKEVFMNVLPINHVFCINGDVFLVIRYGGTLCPCPNLQKVMEYIKVFEPTAIRLVPMMAKMFYNKIVLTAKQNEGMSLQEAKNQVLGENFHRLVSGGGYLAPDLAKNFAELGIQIGQGYGMSECSPKISSPVYERLDKLESVGKLVDRCEVRIVDGEIQVKSPSVMLGYYKDAEETAKALTEDGWLCTGDLGYVDDEDYLYLTGRKKNLIILSNGENVSPEGIENGFDTELLISDILVYGVDEVIAAEVYPNFEYARVNKIEDVNAAVQQIIQEHNKDLPSYSQIAQCHVRNIPFEKTTSKKIIRQKFFEEKKKEKERTEEVRKPENDLQQSLYDIAADVIGNSLFGIDSNLYDCGLDSMGSILLIEELHARLGHVMTFHDLLEQNSILKMEAFLQEEKEEAQIDFSVRETYPLTNMQKYFGYIIRGNTTGNLPFTYKLDDSVDLEKLKKVIEEVIDAHPGLKGIIKPDEVYLKLFRDDSRKIDIPIIHLTEKEWEETVDGLLKPYTYTADDNLFHISLYQTESSKYLFLDVAHIMGDGISMNVIFEDINKLYRGEEIEKETDYSTYEYILEVQNMEESGVREKSLDYYEEMMDGIRLQRSIFNRKDIQDYSKGEYGVFRDRFHNINRNKILYFCKQNGISENVVFLTAFNYCIYLFSDEDDVFSNSIHSGRTDNRWTRLVGPLFLTYYCRYTREPHERVIELLHRTGKQIMNTMRCFVSAPREGEMFFQFQGDIIGNAEIAGGKVEKIQRQLDSLPFHMQVMTDDEGYYMELRYWENRMDKKLLEIFLASYECIINAMLDERSVRRLKRHLPEELYPKHIEITVGELNKEAGFEMISGVAEGEIVKPYILDESYYKKPFGAWGELYIMNHEPDEYVETVENSYSPGLLYHTKHIARILPDGSIDFMENSGRIVMTEGARGRFYYDLKALEKTLSEYEGVTHAEAYIRYDKSVHEMSLYADVSSEEELDLEAVKAYVESKHEALQVPKEIFQV
ncbi:MAG: AMP-binding protein [Lachnospiraceae bacterium]|nr:AMP-binding protein [Lachnospiraceae bacterium]